MKLENLRNQISVAKINNFGSKLPLDRRPISIPKPFLLDKFLVDQLKEHGKGYSSETVIEPLDACELLKRLPDTFQSRRLKDLFLRERDSRLMSCRSEGMRRNILSVFADIQDVVIGSYDFSQDDVFVPDLNSRLAKVIKLPIRSESCLQKRNTQKGPNSELTF